jgi:hypothetical protein
MGEENITKIINENPDSIEIGTPAKGGGLKCYGNFDDVEAFKTKILNAKQVMEFARANLTVSGF